MPSSAWYAQRLPLPTPCDNLQRTIPVPPQEQRKQRRSVQFPRWDRQKNWRPTNGSDIPGESRHRIIAFGVYSIKAALATLLRFRLLLATTITLITVTLPPLIFFQFAPTGTLTGSFLVLAADQLSDPQYPGVTHLLRRDGDVHVVKIILLESVAAIVQAGKLDISQETQRSLPLQGRQT